MPFYEVMPRLVPAHHVIEADSTEAAVEQAVEDWAEQMSDRGNVIVRELPIVPPPLSQDDYNRHIMASDLPADT